MSPLQDDAEYVVDFKKAVLALMRNRFLDELERQTDHLKDFINVCFIENDESKEPCGFDPEAWKLVNRPHDEVIAFIDGVMMHTRATVHNVPQGSAELEPRLPRRENGNQGSQRGRSRTCKVFSARS